MSFISDADARKVIVIEVKVMDDTGCFPDFLQCDEFEANFVDQVGPAISFDLTPMITYCYIDFHALLVEFNSF